MSSSFLKLNDDKTELVIFGSLQQLKKVELHAVYIDDSLVNVMHNVRNLGVPLDAMMTMVSHVIEVCNFHVDVVFKTHLKTRLFSRTHFYDAMSNNCWNGAFEMLQCNLM